MEGRSQLENWLTHATSAIEVLSRIAERIPYVPAAQLSILDAAVLECRWALGEPDGDGGRCGKTTRSDHSGENIWSKAVDDHTRFHETMVGKGADDMIGASGGDAPGQVAAKRSSDAREDRGGEGR